MERSRIHGIACEDNNSLKYINLKCSDKFEDISAIQANFVQMIARCPDCNKLMMAGEFSPEIVGDKSGYHPQAHVCSAATHSGKMVKTPAGFMISLINAGKKLKFVGSESNGYTSKGINLENEVIQYQIDS